MSLNTFIRDQVMRIMSGHRGRSNALSRRDLLAHLQLFRPTLSDREMRELYSGLPICSCAEGLFLPDHQNIPKGVQEVLEFKTYLTKQSGPIVAYRRCATIYAYYPKLVPPACQMDLPL